MSVAFPDWRFPLEKAAPLHDLKSRMRLVEGYISSISAHAIPGTEVNGVLDDAVGPKGKRIRPLLVLACASLGPDAVRNEDLACRLAATVELIHTASLIHDDIVDEAPLRRGMPSVQHSYGKKAAVYAGDYLMAGVLRYICEEGLQSFGGILCEAVQKMCVGEIGQALALYRSDVSLEGYLANIEGKTTALIKASCVIGALAGGCTAEQVGLLGRFGERLGALFQIRDDLLDFVSSERHEGKELHRDFREGIYTLPVILALRDAGCQTELAPLMEASKERDLTRAEVGQMESIVTRHGGVSATRKVLAEYQRACRSILEGLRPGPGTLLLGEALERLEVKA